MNHNVLELFPSNLHEVTVEHLTPETNDFLDGDELDVRVRMYDWIMVSGDKEVGEAMAPCTAIIALDPELGMAAYGHFVMPYKGDSDEMIQALPQSFADINRLQIFLGGNSPSNPYSHENKEKILRDLQKIGIKENIFMNFGLIVLLSTSKR